MVVGTGGGGGIVLHVPVVLAVVLPAGQVTVAVSMPFTGGGVTVVVPFPCSWNEDVAPVDQLTVTVSPAKSLYPSVNAVQVSVALVMWFASAAGASTRQATATPTAPMILLFTAGDLLLGGVPS